MSTVADCPDEATCSRERHYWTPEPSVIHNPRVCLRGLQACGLCRRLGHADDACPSNPDNWPNPFQDPA